MGIVLKYVFCLAVVMLVAAPAGHAIVIRPGVPDSKYVVSENAFPPLVDLPGEGNGVLIAKRWVVTVGHTARTMRTTPPHNYVIIGGKRRSFTEVILYPGFLAEYRVFEDALSEWASGALSGDAAPLMAKAASVHDMALIKLTEPVEDVKPIALYRGSNEQGKLVKIYGKGATGNGLVGEYPHSPHRGKLRRAHNRITSAHEHWLLYKFDCGPGALSLEGVSGSGDSGGPVLIQEDGEWKLAGLDAQSRWKGDLSKYRSGVCGQEFASSRISYYAAWIDSVIAAHMVKSLLPSWLFG